MSCQLLKFWYLGFVCVGFWRGSRVGFPTFTQNSCMPKLLRDVWEGKGRANNVIIEIGLYELKSCRYNIPTIQKLSLWYFGRGKFEFFLYFFTLKKIISSPPFLWNDSGIWNLALCILYIVHLEGTVICTLCWYIVLNHWKLLLPIKNWIGSIKMKLDSILRNMMP